MMLLAFLSILFSSVSSLHPTGNFYCDHIICFWPLSLLRVAHFVVSGWAFSLAFHHLMSGLFYISARAAGNLVLSYNHHPDPAFPWVTTLLWFGFCADWLLVLNTSLLVCFVLFENLPSCAHRLKLCLAITVDLRGIRSSFRSYTYVEKVKPCISVSWWSFNFQ